MDITEEMKELIAKNLPAATAGAMSEFIQEAKDAAEELMSAKEIINGDQITIKEQGVQIDQLLLQIESQGKQDAKKKLLDERQEDLAIQARDINLTEARIRLEESQKRSDIMMQLVGKVFGHPAVTVSTTGIVPVPVEGGSGCMGSVIEANMQEITTTTENKV